MNDQLICNQVRRLIPLALILVLVMAACSTERPMPPSSSDRAGLDSSSTLASAPASPNPTMFTPGVSQNEAGDSKPLPGIGRVDGVVVDESGALVADCVIERTPLTPGLAVEEPGVSTNAKGEFRVNLNPGLWLLEATCPNGWKGRIDSLRVPDQGVINVKIAIEPDRG